LIVRSQVHTDERLDFEFLFEDSYVVVAGAKPVGATAQDPDLRAGGEVLVLPPPGSVIGSIITQTFRAAGLDYPRASVVTGFPPYAS